VVPGAGIEPARLAARDFESRDKLNIHAGFGLFCSAKKFFFVLYFSLEKCFLRNDF